MIRGFGMGRVGVDERSGVDLSGLVLVELLGWYVVSCGVWGGGQCVWKCGIMLF